MKKSRRLLSLFLALVMFMAVLPAEVRADNDDNEEEQQQQSEEGLMVHYNMELSENGESLKDQSDNENNAPLVGMDSSDIVNDDGRTVLKFTGSKSQYAKLPNGILTGEEFTIETEFKTSVTTSHWLWTIGTIENSWPNVKNYIFLNPRSGTDSDNGSIRTGMYNSSSEKLLTRSTAATADTSQYNLATITYDGSTYSLYLNGVFVTSQDIGYSVQEILTNGVTDASDCIGYLGKSLYSPDAAYSGTLSDFKVYNYVRSDEEIQKAYEDSIISISDEEKLNADADSLTIPNMDEIRGNITLPTKGSNYGSSITWQSSNETVISTAITNNTSYDSTPAGVVTRQDLDTKVTLTATIDFEGTSTTKSFEVTVLAKPDEIAESDYTDYLFVGFASDSDENIYFASSNDSLTWSNLNDGDALLKSDVGTTGVRDPYIIRSAEGDKFYLIATDLKVNDVGWSSAQNQGSQSLVVWESTDLVNWSNARLVPVSTEINAGCTWAPEAIYDSITGEYVVFWASKVAGDGYAKQRMYYAKTRDFYTFTEPQLFFERDWSSIDTTMIEYAGEYYRYTKNENDNQKYIFPEKTSTVLSEVLGYGYETLDSSNLTSIKWVEGPTIFKLNDDDIISGVDGVSDEGNQWCIWLDDYGGDGYYPLITDDITESVFTALSSDTYQMPSSARHGTVLRITAEEYKAVMEAYGTDDPINTDPEEEEPIINLSFEEGTDYSDILTLFGNAQVTQDSAGNGTNVLTLDGTTGTYAAFDTGFFDGRNKMTISMDVKTNMSSSDNFFTFTIGKSDSKYMFMRTRPTTWSNVITTGSWGAETGTSYNFSSSQADTWHNIKIVVDEKEMRLYIDNVLGATNTSLGNIVSDLGKNLEAYLGKSFYSGDKYFNGAFDNIEIYNRALSDEEITGSKVVNTSVNVEDLTIEKGETASLPDTVTASYSDGSEKNFGVTWNEDDISAIDTSKAGTYTVTGTVNQTTYSDVLVEQRADPWVILADDGYYYFTASYPVVGTNDTEGYDRIVLRRSKTINGLTDAQEVTIWHQEDSSKAYRYVWAPELHEINGTWYIMFAASTASNSVWSIRPYMLECVGDDLMDPNSWKTDDESNLYQMTAQSGDSFSFTGFSLDMTYFEVNGTHYVVWAQKPSTSNLYIATIDPDNPWQLTSEGVLLSQPDYAWESGSGETINEGAVALIRDDTIYLFFSGGATDYTYCVGMLSASLSDNLLEKSSWTKNPAPLLTTDDLYEQYGPGHNSFTTDENGNLVIVYHARPENCDSSAGAGLCNYVGNSNNPLVDPCRHARAKSVNFAADGTPILNMTEEEELLAENRTVTLTITVKGDESDPVDKSNLKALYEENKDLDSTEYTAESWAVFASALKTAEEVLENDSATKTQVESALSALQTAIDGLKKAPVDKSKLEALYEYYKDLDSADYTTESWDVFASALKTAQEVLENDSATKTQVESALSALQAAIDGLEKYVIPEPVDKDELQKLYNEYKDLDSADYTAESWEVFEKALESVEDVLDDTSATQVQVNEALEALKTAIEGLEQIEVITHTIKGIANTGGTVAIETVVAEGKDAQITVTANEGYKLVAILVDGVTVNLEDMEDGVYNIENVQKDMTLIALFVMDQSEDFAAIFSDVPKITKGEITWYYEKVDMLTGLGITDGTSPTTYEPEREVTRAEFTKLLFELAKVLGVEVQTNESIPFTDMPVEDHWAIGYIGWAYENGIVDGYNETTFGPEDTILRQDMALMMQRFFEEFMGYELPGDETITFTDAEDIGDYAEDAVEYVVKKGVMEGYEDGAFRPEGNTLRSEVAQVLYNFLIN